MVQFRQLHIDLDNLLPFTSCENYLVNTRPEMNGEKWSVMYTLECGQGGDRVRYS